MDWGRGWEVDSLWVILYGVDIAYPSLRRKAAKISICGKHGKEGVRVPTCCTTQAEKVSGFKHQVPESSRKGSQAFHVKNAIYRKKKSTLRGFTSRLPFFHLRPGVSTPEVLQGFRWGVGANRAVRLLGFWPFVEELDCETCETMCHMLLVVLGPLLFTKP